MIRIASTTAQLLMVGLTVYALASSIVAAAPLAVEEAVHKALQNSPAVAASQKELERAEAREMKSMSAFLPRLDFQEQYIRTDQPVASFGSLLNQGRFTREDFALTRLNDPDSLDNFQTRVVVRQPLFMGGRVLNQYRATTHQTDASAWDLEMTRAEVGFNAVERYWGLSLAKESEKVAEAAVRTAEESLRQIEVLHKEGAVVRSDLLSAMVRLADFQDGLVKARGRVKVAEKALNLLIGTSPDGFWHVAALAPPTEEEIPDMDPSRLLSLAKEHRPEYTSLRARVDSAVRARKAAQAEVLPSIGLEARYEWNSPRLADGQEGSYLLGLGFEWNLFKGLEDRAAIQEAKSNEEMIRHQLRALEDRIILEIEEACVAVTTGQESIRVTDKSIGQAEENLRIVQQRYRAGLTTVVELEQAELALSRSRLEWLSAIHDLRIALARLKLSTGELVPVRQGSASRDD